MDVDRTLSSNSINSRIIQRRSVSSVESGIELTQSRANDSDDVEEISDSELSGIENVKQSTPLKKKTKKCIPLKLPLSIYKIDLDKVDATIDKKDPSKIGVNKSNEERIGFMIQLANPKPKKERGRRITPQCVPYLTYALMQYQGHYDSTIFELKLFAKTTLRTDNETGVELKNFHKVRFMYRTASDIEEIFALPSGSGRSVVLQWADTDFPLSIAKATLEEESVTEKEVKNLNQNRYLTKFKMEKGESLTKTPEFHLRFVPQVYTKFNANINDNNSGLKKILGQSRRSKVKMGVQLNSVMFPGIVIDINGYAVLCRKLSEIHNNPNLPRSRKFDGYLSKVSKDRGRELDKLLHRQLDQFFRKTPGPESDAAVKKLENFSIVQKDSEKYYEASRYLIHHRGKQRWTFEKRPQLQDIHTIVNRNFEINSFDSFVKSFDALSISTPSSSDQGVKEKLFNCLEGVFYDETDENNYWRVCSDWYVMSGKYTFDVYAEYIEVIKKSLLCKDECSLTILWPLKPDREIPRQLGVNSKKYNFDLKMYLQNRFAPEGMYNQLYSGKLNFVVTDCIQAPYGVETCDLFEFFTNSSGKSKIQLHHVKNVYGADGYRVAIWQILCSASFLYNSILKGHRKKNSSAFRLFECIEKDQERIETIPKSLYSNYKEFLDQLRDCKIESEEDGLFSNGCVKSLPLF